MKPWELYNYQKDIDYRTNTFDYDWRVKVDNDERTIYVFSQFSTSVIDWIVNFLFFMIPQVRQWYVYFACLGWQTTFNSCKCSGRKRKAPEHNRQVRRSVKR